MHTADALYKAVDLAVGFLRAKGVIAFPTDTLYGLGADAFCVQAVARVYDIKGRAGNMALPLLIGNVQDLGRVAREIPDSAYALVDRFWPGPLTLILKRSPDVPDIVVGGGESVAVRMPDHEVPLALLRKLGGPITGTSANPSGGPDPVTVEDVVRLLGDRVDYIVDGGPATAGAPSTIVDLSGPAPRLVRPGVIPYHSVESVCPLSVDCLEG